jgi:hypothetical protein
MRLGIIIRGSGFRSSEFRGSGFRGSEVQGSVVQDDFSLFEHEDEDEKYQIRSHA